MKKTIAAAGCFIIAVDAATFTVARLFGASRTTAFLCCTNANLIMTVVAFAVILFCTIRMAR